jgi:hypothetical protein
MSHVCQFCKKASFKHAPSLSRHKKTCREAIIAEYVEEEKIKGNMVIATNEMVISAEARAKMSNLDLLNAEYGNVPDVVAWGNGLQFTCNDVDNVIEYGPSEFLTCLKRYIEKTPSNMRPIKVINCQKSKTRFKMYMREIEDGKAIWKPYLGDKGFEAFVRFTTYKLGNRMRMVKYIGEWIKEHPLYEIDYSKDEEQYRNLRSCFGYNYDDKAAPMYALDIIDYFVFKKAMPEVDEDE